MRRFWLAAALLAAMAGSPARADYYNSDIIPEPTAAHHGLTRSWFTQIEMDASRGRIRDIVLDGGALFVQTDRAMVHAIDAETGRTLWARQLGRPGHPSMTPGLSRDLIAIINGSRLYVANRFNGSLLFETQVDGAPGAGPGVSDRRAYVPMVDGMLLAYKLEQLANPLKELGKIPKTDEERITAEKDRHEGIRLKQEFVPPLATRSAGRALVQPLVTAQNAGEEFVAWPTDRGYMYVGRIDRRQDYILSVKYRLTTAAPISSRPTYLPPDPKNPAESGIIFATSHDGFVYAVEERSGNSLWRFSTGEPILQAATVVGDRVFFAVQAGGLYCLKAKTGVQQWFVPSIRQFIASSRERVYALDGLGQIVVLRADNGGHVDSIPIRGLPYKVVNGDTDRLYLANETGLLQCLREIELTKPVQHGEARKRRLGAAADAGEPKGGPKKGVVAGKKAGKKAAGEEAPEAVPAADDPFADTPAKASKPKAPKAGKKAEADDAPAADAGEDPFAPTATKPKAPKAKPVGKAAGKTVGKAAGKAAGKAGKKAADDADAGGADAGGADAGGAPAAAAPAGGGDDDPFAPAKKK